MSATGLSLVGFMGQERALAHLGQQCIPPDPAPEALLAAWRGAQARLGTPMANSGHPEIRELPAEADAHVSKLSLLPWMQRVLHGHATFGFKGFALVEIDPLIAFQMVVNVDRSVHHRATLGALPQLHQLLNVCLPTDPPMEHFQVQRQSNALIIKARELNLRMQEVGRIQTQFAGVIFGPALPLVQVTKFNGRLYLSDGYHRAYCLRQTGATHIPCILREVSDPSEVGLNSATFGRTLLESASPPTIGHYTQGRAHEVMLRTTSRVIHVSWSEWVVPDDD